MRAFLELFFLVLSALFHQCLEVSDSAILSCCHVQPARVWQPRRPLQLQVKICRTGRPLGGSLMPRVSFLLHPRANLLTRTIVGCFSRPLGPFCPSIDHKCDRQLYLKQVEAGRPPEPPSAASQTADECASPDGSVMGSAFFEVARRWLTLCRVFRGAPTAESRIKILMHLAFQETNGSDFLSFTGKRPLTRIKQSAHGPSASSEALESGSAAGVDEASVCPSTSDLVLSDIWRPVTGCAAVAAVKVSLHYPVRPQQRSLAASITSNSRLCCVAAKQGAKVHVHGESDSLVVGGLLQLLSRSLSGSAPCGVFALSALGSTKLLQFSSLLNLLPDSRVRGFRTAMHILMGSTQDLLQRYFCNEVLPPPAELPQNAHGEQGTAPNKQDITTGRTQAKVPKGTSLRPPRPANDALSGYRQEPHGDQWGNPIPQHALPSIPRSKEIAKLAAKSRVSLPLSDGAGAEVHVLVSGGVDSAVSLLLMREWGFRPKPIFLKVWAPEAAQMKEQLQGRYQQEKLDIAAASATAAAACPWREDAKAAAAVAAAAGLSLEVVPMQQQYWDRVISGFLEGARAGLTLNPDWSCNSSVKFGAFAETLDAVDYRIASGHYARILIDEGCPRLLRGVDLTKDQSYFLSGLSSLQLSRLLFPVGALLKTQVRKIAVSWGLPSSQRPDSQGLCFLGPLPVSQFLMHLLGEEEGPVIHFPTGVSIGRHKGLWGFTVGQQKGVVPLLDPRLCRRCHGASGGPPKLSGPWSVVGKLPEANALFVVSKEEEAAAEDRLRALATEPGNYSEPLGAPLLRAAANGDKAAALALKLRQLRTCLRVDNIRWFHGKAPAGFDASATLQPGCLREEGPTLAAVAASAVAAAKTNTALPMERPAESFLTGSSKGGAGFVVQVRHSAGFHGVAKHNFKVLCVSRGHSGNSSPIEEAELLLEEPDVGLAPGQVAAFYRDDECIGSGRISALQGSFALKSIIDRLG
ncbi:tRNA methyltransferase domain-containing protein, putative [Eimeria tenella]|uniref:tRNA-5-taurinomethyluridine 2-sulfurtransferase n=1 Tax=Eimeria tenella TaxID=5802 RepID=U6KYB5_EIMTE|nr:tRNA methyltransferase domain-containing protein, putative [Eimeria tenella]CDJ42936.1 tRNA methyltransferase domain-containing protein, putative [Eimeria tenella]|eukprot:XP_013233686.1 tRNA methyltransferase domain-containing protein, putative [Eimeria tenella]